MDGTSYASGSFTHPNPFEFHPTVRTSHTPNSNVSNETDENEWIPIFTLYGYRSYDWNPNSKNWVYYRKIVFFILWQMDIEYARNQKHEMIWKGMYIGCV